jgi:hypothetical protein
MKNLPVCPFCGYNRLSVSARLSLYDDTPIYFIYCQRCLARGPECEREETSLALWGVRYTPLLKATLEGFTNEPLVTALKPGEKDHA